MNEILTNLSKVLPQLAVLAVVFGFIGWSLRGLGNKPAPAKPTTAKPPSEKGQSQERVRNLETALEKSRSAHKALKTEFDQLKAGTVSAESFQNTTAELEAARKALEAETKRISSIEADLKKSQETVKNLNARANEVDKSQKDRSFALENELSKAREQLALLQNRPDDSAELQTEIERLRESVATTTRFAGELRKREAAAVEALEKAEARLANALETGKDIPVTSKKIGPVVESGRIAAAKAEVLRLVELNKQKAAEAVEIPAAPVEVPAAAVEIPAPPVEVVPEVVESAPEPVEEVPVVAEIEPTPEPLPNRSLPKSQSQSKDQSKNQSRNPRSSLPRKRSLNPSPRHPLLQQIKSR